MSYYKSSNKQIAQHLTSSMYPVPVFLIGDKALYGADHVRVVDGDGAPAVFGVNFSLSIFHNEYK